MKNNNEANGVLKEFWNTRFSGEDYVYGKKPNAFFKSQIDGLPPGRILVPGAGEGRDAVYAAKRGWEVYCADVSVAGKDKAMRLADENHVDIEYFIAPIEKVSFPDDYFDVIASIFFHLPTATRRQFYGDAVRWLRKGGLFIMQGFTPGQLKFNSGGPKDEDLLINAGQTAGEITGMEISTLKESEILLDEGTHHRGKGSVLDLVGRKK